MATTSNDDARPDRQTTYDRQQKVFFWSISLSLSDSGLLYIVLTIPIYRFTSIDSGMPAFIEYREIGNRQLPRIASKSTSVRLSTAWSVGNHNLH